MPINDVIRLAGHANHWLAVFDKSTGHALDLFRARRTASPAQRIMLIARDGGCTKPCCAVPAYGAQVHHALRDWADGGNTNVNEMTLACGPDNRLVDKDGGWSTTINDRGDVEWAPPPTSTPAKPASTTTTAPNYSCAHQTTRRKPRTRTIDFIRVHCRGQGSFTGRSGVGIAALTGRRGPAEQPAGQSSQTLGSCPLTGSRRPRDGWR